MSPNEMREKLLSFDPSPEMQLAVADGIFFVVVSDTLCGPSIGSMSEDLPCVYATLEAAEADNADMVASYLSDIEEGEREEGDEWEADVMRCKWDLGDIVELYLGDALMARGKWTDMAGF